MAVDRGAAFTAFQRNKAQEASGNPPPAPTPTDAPTAPEGTPPVPKGEETPPDPVVTTTDTSNPEPTEPPADLSTELTPEDGDTPKAEETASGEGSPEDEEGDEDNKDLDDDTLAALAKMYPEKLLATEGLKATVDARVQDEVATQLRETTATTEGAQRVQEVIEQGKQAATRMGQQAEAANELIAKAAAIEDSGIDPNTTGFDPQTFKDDLTNYGAAVVAELTERYDTAFTAGVQNIFEQMPDLTEDQQGAVLKIVEQAKRMEGDPKQAASSKAFFTKSVLQFLYTSALEVGATQERARLVEYGKTRKTISESAAVKQAAAKIVKNRGNLPPETPGASAPVASGEPAGRYDSDYYRGLKKEGKLAEAQAYVNKFGRGAVTAQPARV